MLQSGRMYRLIQKRFDVGDTVTVHSIFGGYPLPKGLEENEAVTVVATDTSGWVEVKGQRGQFSVFLACIDSGWVREPW